MDSCCVADSEMNINLWGTCRMAECFNTSPKLNVPDSVFKLEFSITNTQYNDLEVEKIWLMISKAFSVDVGFPSVYSDYY